MGAVKTLIIDSNVIYPSRSQRVVNHSPDGFNWGYRGSGPAQTALAILLECTSQTEALLYYQNYKSEKIASLPSTMNVLIVRSEDVQDWLKSKK